MPKLQFKPVPNLPNVFSAPDYIIEHNGDRPGKPWRAFFHGYLDIGHYASKQLAMERCELHLERGS